MAPEVTLSGLLKYFSLNLSFYSITPLLPPPLLRLHVLARACVSSTSYPSQRSKRIFEDLEKKNCYGRTHGQKHNGQRVYKIDAWSTRPFAHALNRLPALLNAHCLIHSRAPLRSFLCLLARSLAALIHSLAPSLDHELMQKRFMVTSVVRGLLRKSRVFVVSTVTITS